MGSLLLLQELLRGQKSLFKLPGPGFLLAQLLLQLLELLFDCSAGSSERAVWTLLQTEQMLKSDKIKGHELYCWCVVNQLCIRVYTNNKSIKVLFLPSVLHPVLLAAFSSQLLTALKLTVVPSCPFSSVICLVSDAILALACSLSLVKRASASSLSFCNVKQNNTQNMTLRV